MKILQSIFPLLFVVLLSSCSDRIVGTWQISRYEKGAPGDENVKVYNIGTMRFKNNKTGEKEINYSILRNKVSDNSSFKWSATEDYLTIQDENSEFSKTWIRVENKRKLQLLKSTNGANNVQVLELKK
ncbi:lipocalin family protein [Rubrolithibacter danxiaensis]|uniref:lipocalin family protein n=1 Tax=Rubrolithibacter danxiaensis TaxID=3390805 RepID=UPI003BF7FB1E